jgi:hypothetical protein
MTAMSAQSASDAANPFPDLPAIRGLDANPPSDSCTRRDRRRTEMLDGWEFRRV